MSKTYIIAEVGPNHNGSLKIAKKLIRAAKRANVDFIKFQTYNVDSLIIKKTKKANYQNKNDQNQDQTTAPGSFCQCLGVSFKLNYSKSRIN